MVYIRNISLKYFFTKGRFSSIMEHEKQYMEEKTMKKIAIMLVLALVLGLFAGCAGNIVVVGDCTCPTGGHTNNPAPQPTTPKPTQPAPEGALKTGLAIVTSVAKSENAKVADYDVTLVAVLVDDNGVIQDCIIDSIGAKVEFDATGTITSDINAEVKTKNELGDAYGMVAWGGAIAEWYQQADALAQFAIGKTVSELKNGAIDETGKAPAGSDLASSATIYLGGYVSAMEEAVKNAQHLGAQGGDELRLAAIPSLKSSVSATAEKAGTAQLDCDVTALTVKDGIITSCFIDSLQAKVSFGTDGVITTDTSAPAATKNQLGEKYGMVAWGGAIAEWNVQAASFASYVTGKTAAQVAGIAVNEGTKPTGADLATSVTIAIGGFQALIAKALA